MTPSNPLPDGKYKFDVGGGSVFTAMTCASGIIEIYAASTEEGNNINIYGASGNLQAQNGSVSIITAISEIASQYDNFIRIEKTASSGNIADFDQYTSIN